MNWQRRKKKQQVWRISTVESDISEGGKMARKKEDKDGKYKRITSKSKKPSRDSKGVDSDVIKSQLLTLGLTLREVPGDG